MYVECLVLSFMYYTDAFFFSAYKDKPLPLNKCQLPECKYK